MSESPDNIVLNNSRSENESESYIKINSLNIQNDLNDYISKNGNKINLSGKDLQNIDNQNILQQLTLAYPNTLEINLNNCNLNIFPNELLTFKNLSSLDIRNNHFSDFELLVEKLLNFNNLTDLKMDLNDQNQVLTILTRIQKLLFLNGESTKNAVSIVDIDEKDIENISLKNDLPLYNDIVNKINEKKSDQNFVTTFKNNLCQEVEKVKKCLNNNVPNYLYANVVIQSQFILLEYLSKKFLALLDEDMKKIGQKIFESVFKSGRKLVELFNILYPKIEEKTDILRNQLEHAWKAAEEISDYENKYNETKKLNNILKNENEIIKMKLNGLETENQAILQKLLNISKNNNIANTNIDSSLNNNNTNLINNNDNNFTNGINKDETKNLINVESKIMLKDNIINTANNNNQTNINYESNNNNDNTINTYIKNIITNNGPKNKVNIIIPKLLSIKMTKDIMNEIYNSKINYDKKCYENKIPRETLEQHMYTYLNQKYGLKNLIIEWAASIINAIKIYSNEDSDINLFGKILKNEQEEDSKLVIDKLKENISELLEYYLKSKNPFKTKKEIKKLLDNKKGGYLNEEEWKGIINYIYSEEEAKIIENKIINIIQNKTEKKNGPLPSYSQTGVGQTEIINNTNTNSNNVFNNLTSFMNLNNTFGGSTNNNFNINTNILSNYSSFYGTTRKLTREELINLAKLKEELNISYKEFLKLLCDHHIKNRDKYLKNFVKLFRKYDTDLDGVINEDEFIGLMKEIPYFQNDIDNYIIKFLSIIDPFNNKKITFSECVSLFNMEIIEEENINKDNNLNINNNINNGKSFNKDDNNNNDINIDKSNKKKLYKKDNKVNLLDIICLENS